MFCFPSSIDAKLHTFECTLCKSFATKPQHAMNMFIHSCFKNNPLKGYFYSPLAPLVYYIIFWFHHRDYPNLCRYHQLHHFVLRPYHRTVHKVLNTCGPRTLAHCSDPGNKNAVPNKIVFFCYWKGMIVFFFYLVIFLAFIQLVSHLAGSPPKCAMFSTTHCRAAIWKTV